MRVKRRIGGDDLRVERSDKRPPGFSSPPLGFILDLIRIKHS
jgi:hypothetical protein